MHLAQIGNVNLHLHQERWHGYKHEGDASFTEMFRARSEYIASDQFNPKPVAVSIESKMVSNRNFTDQQQIQRLLSIRGAPMPIIGYVIDGSRDPNCACQQRGDCTMLWLSTYGILKSVEAQQEDMNGLLSITLELELFPYWQPLNRYIWHRQSSDFNYISPPPAPATYQEMMIPFPDCNMFQREVDDMRWVRHPVSNDILYDPDLWAVLPTNAGVRYPTFSNQSDWTTDFNHTVYLENSLWGAPPMSIYGITNITEVIFGGDEELITITVTRDSPIQQVVEVTVIDIAATNDNMAAAGYTSLLNTDRIYIGDLHRKPGFIMRSGAILSNVYPSVTYPNMWPGMLSPGFNSISINLGVFTAEVSWQHLYRRF